MTDPLGAGSTHGADGRGSETPAGRSKKVYTTPTLVRWGAVEDLTRGGPGIQAEGTTTGSGGGG
jgi:hypothetical protein